jgi:hypothetical protein
MKYFYSYGKSNAIQSDNQADCTKKIFCSMLSLYCYNFLSFICFLRKNVAHSILDNMPEHVIKRSDLIKSKTLPRLVLGEHILSHLIVLCLI